MRVELCELTLEQKSIGMSFFFFLYHISYAFKLQLTLFK